VIPRPSADYFVVGRRQKGESLKSYWEYLAKSLGKQREKFLLAALEKNYQDYLSGIKSNW
jgi:hypothetical protein